MPARVVAGRYRMNGVLGRGGMGVVWRGSDELIGRSVAVKELRVPTGSSEGERASFNERALREARTAGRLSHPGVVAIYDLVPATEQDDAVYIVMELVEAPSLAQLLQSSGGVGQERVVGMARQLFATLAAAHGVGLVHRDVKPSNIMVLPGDRVKLLDFGIAHAMDDTRLTRQGVAGSTGYMAPELFEGADPSPAVDAWSLGATLFQAVEGFDPFARPTTAATLHAILHDSLPSLTCGAPLSEVIAGLLTRDINERLSIEQAAALLDADTPATPAASTPAAPAPRPDDGPRQDETTSIRPTTPPAARRSPASPNRPTQASWADHPTTTGHNTLEIRMDMRGSRKTQAGCLVFTLVPCSALAILLWTIDPEYHWSFAAPLGVVSGLSLLIFIGVFTQPRIATVRGAPDRLAYKRGWQKWSVEWRELQRITVRLYKGARGRTFWEIEATHLNRNAKIPPSFRQGEGTATLFLRFSTEEQARDELARLDIFLRAHALTRYQAHGDLADLLDS